MTDRPNVLWICTDQQFSGAMSCEGNNYLETPAIDRIASEGTRFSNAYCTAPSCTPSRMSMLTGRMPSTVSVDGNGDVFDETYQDELLGNVFSKAGYECAYAGKGPGFGDEGKRHIGSYHGFDELCGLDDRRMPDACAEFFQRSRDQPFLLVANFDNPHNICEWSRDYTTPWGTVEDRTPEECPPLPTNHAVPPYEPKIIRDIIENDWAQGAMDGATNDEWRQYRDAYFQLIEMADKGIATILDALEDNGYADDTLIVFTSDHGDGHGAHKTIQKGFMYEEMIRVPFIVRPPGGSDESSSDQLVSTGLDLLPTLCEYANVDHPSHLPGQSVQPVIENESTDRGRDYVVTETIRPKERLDGRMIRTEKYKYIVYHEQRNNEQLFNLRTDPGEMVDLSTSSNHADILEEHRARLLEWCEEMDDRFGSRYHHPDVPMIPGYDFEVLWPKFLDEPPGFMKRSNE